MVARTLPGKQFEVGRELRARVASAFRSEGINVAAELDTGHVPPEAPHDRAPRTSTVVLVVLFLAVFALYLLVRPVPTISGLTSDGTAGSPQNTTPTATPKPTPTRTTPHASPSPTPPSPTPYHPTTSPTSPSPEGSAHSPTSSHPASPHTSSPRRGYPAGATSPTPTSSG